MRANPGAMATIEVSRTLVKSAPELWTELEGERLSEAVGDAKVKPIEPERALAWEADGAQGTAVLEPSGWGTKVTLTAEIEEDAARRGVWSRIRRGDRPPGGPSRRPELEQQLTELLDDLGSAHRKPYARD